MKQFLVVLVNLILLVNAQSNDVRFVVSHPLHNSTFNHWKALGTSVFLMNKVVLTPQLPAAKGLVYAKNTFQLSDFCFEIDLSIHNKQSSSFTQGDFRIFFLRDNPMQGANEFARGLDGLYDGFQLHIKEGQKRNSDATKGAPARMHEIQGTV